MADLNKRTQVLFSQEQWEELTDIAAEQEQSVGHLIRDAVAVQFFTIDPEIRKQKRLASVNALAAMQAPIEDWAVLKDELENRYVDSSR